MTDAAEAAPMPEDLTRADLDIIRQALEAYHFLQVGTVRQFLYHLARANDPQDSAHEVLSARLPGLRESYDRADALVARIDAVLGKLARTARPDTGDEDVEKGRWP